MLFQTLPLRAPLLAALLLLTGCSLFGLDGGASGSTDAVVTTSNDPVTLDEGASVFLSDLNTRVTFVAKTEDSRCPLGVDCVWEGEVTIVLEITRGTNDPVAVTLKGHVGPEGEGIVTADAAGLRFTLQRVDPYPQYEVPDTGPATIELLAFQPE